MADKRDNRTEQWLQDYARRRREQHGSAPKMHDATRRLLHGEVQRTWGQPAPAAETVGGWEAWALKFATGTVAVGALALGLWVMIDSEKQTTERTNNMGSPMKMTNAGIQPVKALPAPATARRSMAFSTREYSPAQRDVYHDMHRSFSQRVRSTKNKKSGESKDAVAAKFQQSVMRDFEVIRKGNTIQVRDKDGSVYTGHVILASAVPVTAAISGQSSKGGGGISGGSNNGGSSNKGGGGIDGGSSNKGGGGIDGGSSNKGGGGIGGGSNKGGGTTLPPPSEKKLPKIVSNPKGEVNKASVGGPPIPPGKGLRPGLQSAAINSAQNMVYNDNVETPLPINQLNKPLLGHNIRATRQSGREDLYPNFHGRSVWYLFKAPARGNATISTRGSNFDTTLGVFTGNTKDTIWMIGDQEGIPVSDIPGLKMDNNQPNVAWSKVSFPCEEGGEYRVAVDGVGGSTGQIKLTARFHDANGRLLSTLPARKTTAVVSRRKNEEKTLFYFQVTGTNRTSGRPVMFEGFMHNESIRAKEEASSNQLGRRPAAVSPLRIQGRASYGSQRLTVDAFTASAVPTQKK